MPAQTQKNSSEENTSSGILILAIIALLAAIALGTGYYFYTQNRPASAAFPDEQSPQSIIPDPSTPTPSLPEPETTVVPTPAATTPTSSYTEWKTYTYRSPAGGGFSIKYPPGFAVGQERNKDEAYFTIFPSPNPLNKPEVMQIYFEGTGNVRFGQNEAVDEWPFYNQVVQSFQKLK